MKLDIDIKSSYINIFYQGLLSPHFMPLFFFMPNTNSIQVFIHIISCLTTTLSLL